jgi:hypothetical protein
MRRKHLSVCSAVCGSHSGFCFSLYTSNGVTDDSSTLHCKKWSTSICNIIVVVVLRFFEHSYIVEVLGLWGSVDCMEELMS